VFDHRDHAEDLGEQRPCLGSCAEICGHCVDESVGVVQHECKQAVDAVATHGDARRPLGGERLPLTIEDRVHRRALAVDVEALPGCAHDRSSS
jgi:hypothetical protein